MSHTCTGSCWDYIARNGLDENARDCDPFAAREAADHEWATSPDGIIAGAGGMS